MSEILEMELMRKIMLFARMNMHPGMGHGHRGHHGPHEHHRPHGPEGCHGHHGPHGQHGPHGHHCHGKRPLSRERLLVLISRNPDGIRQKDIADNIGINRSSTSELIAKLESDGYIVRKVDPDDKRATLLFLTELGQARAAEVEDERAAVFRDAFAALTDGEKQTLSELLDKLIAQNEEETEAEEE